MPAMSQRPLAAGCWILLVLLALGLLTVWPAGAQAEGGKEDLEDIERAIHDQGLHWTTRDYGGRTFPLGLLDGDEKPALAVPASERSLQRELLDLPTSLDWRNNLGNWVSPVRDQGQCGSCWAFAAVGAMEARYAISQTSPGAFLDLSEQHVVSCDSSNYGCSGGNARQVASYARSYGVPDEACFPYAAADLNCSESCVDWPQRAVHTVEYERVAQSVVALQTALQNGPLQVSFDVYGDFYAYGSGVYEHAYGSKVGGHAVLLVGYVETPGQYGGGYFIVKNSWDDDWGENGFFNVGFSQVINSPIAFGRSAYQYYMTTPPPDAYEPDNSQAQSTPLVVSVPQDHSISGGGDEDWFVFDLGNHLDVVLDTTGIDGGDTLMWLYDQNLMQLAYSDDQLSSFYSKIEMTLDPGRYYVKVGAYYDDIVISAYALSLTTSPPPLYQAPVLRSAAFGSGPAAGGWTSQDSYPRLLGDVDGDDDVVGFGSSSVLVSLAEGGQLLERTVWLSRSFCQVTGWSSYDIYPRFLADVDGDGDDDLVGLGSKKVFVALSDGTQFLPQQVWLEGSFCHIKGWSSQTAYPRFLADLNADGRADIIGFGQRAVYVALAAPGGGFLAQEIWLSHRFSHDSGWSSQDSYPRFLADVDGDGDADIVGIGENAVSVARSTGTTFLDRELWLWYTFCRSNGWASQNTTPRLPGDWNGDEMVDLIGFGVDDVSCSASSGSAFGASELGLNDDWGVNAGWPSQELSPRALGDLDADGFCELVGFGAAGVWTSTRNP
jgi:C1A family cysteine protease